jgi:hypothetical protein|tara:strand:- start:116 stop:391 length:276 start_codon:yes stop_codon:yes gene_type:complete
MKKIILLIVALGFHGCETEQAQEPVEVDISQCGNGLDQFELPYKNIQNDFCEKKIGKSCCEWTISEGCMEHWCFEVAYNCWKKNDYYSKCD